MVEPLQSGDSQGPPPGGPYVPPPESDALPNQSAIPVQQPVVLPPVVPPAPQSSKQPVPQTPPPAPPLPKPPASQPSAAPTGPTDSLLSGDLPTPPPAKPTVEALKIPEGIIYPKEFLTNITSKAPSIEEAQARLDTAHKLITMIQSGASAKNKEWIEALRQDPEVGGKNWEGSVKLYKLGVVEEFGADFAKGLAFGKLDAQPEFFKGVVRRMRAKNPQPMVSGEPQPKEPEATTIEDLAKKTYAGMKTAYGKTKQRTAPTY